MLLGSKAVSDVNDSKYMIHLSKNVDVYLSHFDTSTSPNLDKKQAGKVWVEHLEQSEHYREIMDMRRPGGAWRACLETCIICTHAPTNTITKCNHNHKSSTRKARTKLDGLKIPKLIAYASQNS